MPENSHIQINTEWTGSGGGGEGDSIPGQINMWINGVKD